MVEELEADHVVDDADAALTEDLIDAKVALMDAEGKFSLQDGGLAAVAGLGEVGEMGVDITAPPRPPAVAARDEAAADELDEVRCSAALERVAAALSDATDKRMQPVRVSARASKGIRLSSRFLEDHVA